MTPQEVIQTFMSSLVNHGYSSSSSVATAMLDDAVKASSRFTGIQNVIDNIKADQTQAERQAVEEILGSAYAGKTISDVDKSVLNADAKTYSTTKISNAYVSDSQDNRTTVRRAILERKAYIFLENYCGIQLPANYWLSNDTLATYYTGSDGSTGNVDTGAITGSDANITLTAGDVIYNTTITSALMNDYAKQDGIALSGGVLTIGTGVEKTASSVVPEIGNKYTATATAAQNITTGSHDWIVAATAKNDIITTGGADSVDAGDGNDKIVVGADYASILTGDGKDTIEVGADVNNVTFDDLSSSDTVTVKGTFSVGSAQTDGTTLIVTDTTGNRTLYFSDYTNSAGAKVNGKTFSAWLGTDLNNVSSESVTESASVDETVAQAAQAAQVAEQIDGDGNLTAATEFKAAANATQKLSSLNLDDVNIIAGDIYVGSTKRGEISSDYPNVASFTKNGLTINLLGVSSDKSGSESKLTKKTVDELTDDQKTVIAGIFKWWAKECTTLNEESYGIGFNSSTAAVKDIDLIFYDSQGSGNTLAFVGYTTSGGQATRLTLNVNMNYYAGISSDDADGTGTGTSSYLDRTLAHELTHAIMAANIKYFSSLPQFINEGIAELTHGIDDTRSDTIFGLAYNSTNFANALNLKNTGTGTTAAYAGGYMFLRYLAKQGSLQILTDYANPDAGASWSISGTTATYTVDGTVVATLTGLAKGLAVKGTEIEGITVDGNVITLSKAVLGTSKVALGKTDDFTLALGSDLSDNLVEITNKQWTVSNGTAKLNADYSTGYMLTDAGKSITYQLAKEAQTVVTVKGLAKTDDVTASDFSTTDTVITLKQSMLGTSNVTVTGEGYTLALASDSLKPTLQSPAWSFSNSTATYNQNTSAGFTLSDDAKTASYSALSTTNLATVTGIAKVTDDNKDTVAAAISVSGNVITLGADALATSTVKVTKGDYTLALASDSLQPTLQTPAWDLVNTTATYKQTTSAGFTPADDSKSLTYSKESSATLATVTGIAKVTDDNKDTVAAAIKLNGTTVTLGKNALATSNVKITGDGYTLALAANAPTAAVNTTLWEVNGTKATYKNVDTGYFTQNESTTLTYVKENVIETYATISGLRNGVTTDSFSLSGNVITLTADALDENPTAATKVTLKGDDYTLKLANGITKVAYNDPAFTLNKTTATLASTVKTAGYSVSDDSKTITYMPTNTSTTLATVTGIVNVTTDNQAAVAKALTVSGKKISVNKDALGTSNIKVTGDGYTIALASESLKPLTQTPTWELKGSTATYKQQQTAGFTAAADGKSLIYSKEANATLATVSGVTSLDGISVNDSVITLGADSLGTTTVKVKGDYTLALASNAPTPTLQTPAWNFKNTTATYAQETSAGFTLSDDAKTLNYSKTATNTLATVSGVTSLDGISVNDSVITLGADSLGSTTVKVKGDYTLALASGAPTPTLQTPAWNFKNTSAAYAQETSAGFTLSDDGKTLNYSKTATNTLATVSGIVKVTDENQSAVADAVTINGTVVTLGKNALATSNVKITGDGYTLALADGVPTATTSANVWEVSGTKATYKNISTAYFDKQSDTVYNYVKDKALTTLATVSGIRKGATTDSISLSGNVITLSADALDENPTSKTKITLGNKDAYTLKLASGIADVEYNDPTWTYDKNKATYTATVKTAGYSTSADAKTITYIAAQDAKGNATSNTLATLNGVKSADGISVSGNVITLGADALATSKVTVKGDYTLALASDSLQPTVQTPEWNFKNTNATYVQETSAGFTLSDDAKSLVYTKAKPVTLATVSGIVKVTDDNQSAVADAINLSNNVITIGANALGTSTVKLKGDYTLALASDSLQPTVQTPEWNFKNTAATYVQETSAGFTLSDDAKSLVYTKAKPVTLATVSGIVKVTDDNQAAVADAISLTDNVITIGANALGTSTVKLKGDYTLALESDSLKPIVQTPAWSLKGTSVNYVQETSAGFTLSDDAKSLVYTKAKPVTLVTVSGLKKVTADNEDTIKAALSVSNKVVTVANAALATSNVSVKGDGYTLNLAGDVPTESTLATVWEVSGTKATYKDINTAYFADKDDTTYTYVKPKVVATHATVSGLRKNADASAISISGNVITLTADALDENPTAKTKVTVKGDYTLALASGIANVEYNDPTWSYDNNKATYIATVKTAGYSASTDSKTLTYIPTTDTKGNAVYTTLATLSGVKSASGISTSGNVISIGADALNEKKVTLGKNDDYTLALADSSLSPAAQSDETWSKSGSKVTLSVTMSSGYTLSDDAKTLNYSSKSSDKILAQISGINKEYIGAFEAVQDGDTKAVTLNSVQLSSKVTVSGEYKFNFAAGYSNATITGSAQADNISVAGTGLVVNPGKGNDSVSLGGASNTIIYASGDGDDTIADFTAANDKIKVTKGTPEVSSSGNDAVITVGTGSITLTDAAANVNNIIILDKNDAQIYPANSSALLVDSNFAQDDLHDIIDATPADLSVADLNFKQDATALDTPTVTFGDHDK